MSELTLGSLFDGSGGFPLGGVLAGISFNHLAVRGWFRLQTHKPAWLCGKLGLEFWKNIYNASF